MSQDWRTPVDAGDYFGHAKKRSEIDNRRPVIRRAADLVGPGIGAAATRITDFNNILATYNGFYSADEGAFAAPTSTEGFTGVVVNDSVLGGKQTFTGLETGYEYTRVFTRNPADPASLQWSPWRGTERVPASARSVLISPTNTLPNAGHTLIPPNISTIGQPDTYQRNEESINVLRQGVYTGFIQIRSIAGTQVIVVVDYPAGSENHQVTLPLMPLNDGGLIPFTFWTDTTFTAIRVQVQHAQTQRDVYWYDFAITRVGDAL